METRQKKIGHLLVAVLVALLLFFNATASNYQNSLSTAKQSETETYTNTVANVPVNIEYNNKDYFISGFASNATVALNSSNRIILQKETDETTRSFEVVADLSDAKEGTHTVELQVLNLPTGISATIIPSNISIKIGKRVSKTFPVIGRITAGQLAKGYSVSDISTELKSVKVTTDEDTLAAIDHIEAVATTASNLSANYSGIATLQAVDSEGNVLPVVFSQNETNLKATITKE